MTQVRKSNTELEFSERGEGPVVVLLHGLFGSSDNLMGLGRDLAQDHKVVAFDLPGHGKSPHQSDYSHEAMARRVMAAMRAQGYSRIDLVGHSLGGKISMCIASLAESSSWLSIRKLVIVDIAPRHYKAHHDEVFAGLNNVPVDRPVTRQEADAHLQKHISDAAVRGFLLKSYRGQAQRTSPWLFDVPGLQQQYSKLSEVPPMPTQITCPTLFVKGANSDYLLAEDEAAIKAHFTHPEFKILLGAGHWPHAEKPAAFNRLTRQFLTDGASR